DFNINDPIKRLWKRAANYVIGSMVEKPNRTRYTPVCKIKLNNFEIDPSSMKKIAHL
ncbi:6354_t:CDS:1, partial [Entrophospora sp. SA101]